MFRLNCARFALMAWMLAVDTVAQQSTFSLPFTSQYCSKLDAYSTLTACTSWDMSQGGCLFSPMLTVSDRYAAYSSCFCAPSLSSIVSACRSELQACSGSDAEDYSQEFIYSSLYCDGGNDGLDTITTTSFDDMGSSSSIPSPSSTSMSSSFGFSDPVSASSMITSMPSPGSSSTQAQPSSTTSTRSSAVAAKPILAMVYLSIGLISVAMLV